MSLREITCRECGNCYLQTLVCNTFNKSVADNSVHTWECPKFVPRKQAVSLQFHVPPSMKCSGVTKNKGEYFIILNKRRELE